MNLNGDSNSRAAWFGSLDYALSTGREDALERAGFAARGRRSPAAAPRSSGRSPRTRKVAKTSAISFELARPAGSYQRGIQLMAPRIAKERSFESDPENTP